MSGAASISSSFLFVAHIRTSVPVSFIAHQRLAAHAQRGSGVGGAFFDAGKTARQRRPGGGRMRLASWLPAPPASADSGGMIALIAVRPRLELAACAASKDGAGCCAAHWSILPAGPQTSAQSKRPHSGRHYRHRSFRVQGCNLGRGCRYNGHPRWRLTPVFPDWDE